MIICWNNKKKESSEVCLLKCDIKVSKADLALLQKQNDFFTCLDQLERLFVNFA